MPPHRDRRWFGDLVGGHGKAQIVDLSSKITFLTSVKEPPRGRVRRPSSGRELTGRGAASVM